ncbi:MAG: hypothetical protein KIT43_09850 [Bauldia sp.]|nr:hypothetical protein [Bauldia sp.]
MKVFFDNCTSPPLAATLNGFLEHLGHSAAHIRHLPCGAGASDAEWIAMLAADHLRWIVVTGDGRIRKNPAERAAYRAAGLCGFVLAPSYQKTPLHQQASFLLWRWPEIERLANLIAGPALFELPMTRTGKMTQLPL